MSVHAVDKVPIAQKGILVFIRKNILRNEHSSSTAHCVAYVVQFYLTPSNNGSVRRCHWLQKQRFVEKEWNSRLVSADGGVPENEGFVSQH